MKSEFLYTLENFRIPANDPGVVCVTVAFCDIGVADSFFKEAVLDDRVLLVESPVDDSVYIEFAADGPRHARLLVEVIMSALEECW